MSKFSSRSVVGGHSESGIVAGDEDWSSAWLKKFTHKGSLRLYSVQSDADTNGISAPSYRPISDNIAEKIETNNDVEVNGFHEDEGNKTKQYKEDPSKVKYRKRKEIENEKKKAKELERAEREKAKEKEKADKERAKEERERLRQEQKQRKKDKYSHASNSSQIVKKKKRKEEKEKEKEKRKKAPAPPVPVLADDVTKDENQPEMIEVSPPVVESVTDVVEEERENEKNKSEDEVTTEEKEIEPLYAVVDKSKKTTTGPPEEVQVAVSPIQEEKTEEPHQIESIVKPPVVVETTQDCVPEVKETSSAVEDVAEVEVPVKEDETEIAAEEPVCIEPEVSQPEVPPPILTTRTDKSRNAMSGSTKKVIIIERSDEIIEPVVDDMTPYVQPVQDLEEEQPEPDIVEPVNDIEKNESEPVEETKEIEPLYAVVDKSKKTTKEPSEEVQVVDTPYVKPQLMKIELPDDSELDESKENHGHIEVHVEIQKTEEEPEYATVKKDKKDDVTTVDAAANRAKPTEARPPADVIVTEKVARQIQEQRDGSVASRASTTAGGPRSMIQGQSWAGASKASTEQVLQNANDTAKPNKKPTSKAELIFELGSRGNAVGKLRRPHGIAVTSNNDILVCDSGNHRVQIFGWDCKYKLKWSPDTFRRKIFSRDRFDPGDIAVTPDNKHFIVTDFTTERIYKVSLETLRAKEFEAPGYKGPWGVAVNSQGYIYVAYCISNCIVCFDKNGKFVHKIGQKGIGPGEFGYPCYLAINKRDAIIVAEYHNRRVQVLNPDGAFMFQIGNSEHFREISGVTVDALNNVFVADYKCHRIVMYGNNGAFKMAIGETEDRLDRPEGMAISADGYLVVSDSGNDNVKIFRHWDVRHLLAAMY